MSGDDVGCVPLRFLNPDGKPVSEIRWVSEDILDQPSFVSEKIEDDKSTPVTVTVLGKTRRLVEDVLIWELKITDTPPRPAPTLREQLGRLWMRFFLWRQSHFTLAILCGFALGLIAAWALLRVITPALLAFIEAPMAALVWLWIALAPWMLPLFLAFGAMGMFIAIYHKRPLWYGACLSVMLVYGLIIVEWSDTWAAFIAAEAGESGLQWPASYRTFWAAFESRLASGIFGFHEAFGGLWEVLAILLNTAGFTVFVSTVGELIKLIPTDAEGSAGAPTRVPGASSGTRGLSARQVGILAQTGKGEALLEALADEEIQALFSDYRLQPEPMLVFPLTPIEAPEMVIPPRPDHCCCDC